ncbi:MAG TPA: hypothetical protein VHT03_13245 [Rhizomicrobium sp.]|nr:hypothetical protein [Rhizomicrobium sp.]
MQQPNLPWNVAGITPEAREAARASARREGVSVGEWLTRRILRALPEASTDAWPFAETGRLSAVGESSPFSREPPGTSLRDPYNGQNGHGRSAERSPALAQQFGATETERSASRRAFGDTTWQTPKAADNFDRLTARIAQLDARVAKIESTTATQSTKQADAVKSLQKKVAELSARLSAAASQSASQSTELAKTIQALAGKFSQTRVETDQQNSAMDERLSALAEDFTAVSERVEETRTRGEREADGVGRRVASLEMAVEDIGRDRETVAQLDGSLHTLTRRVETTETEYLNNIEHLETRLTRIEASSGDTMIDRRLQGIEQTLADMATLITKNTPEKAVAAQAVEQPEPAGSQSTPELRDSALHTPPVNTEARPPILDLPPFPQKSGNRFAAAADPVAPSPPHDVRTSAGGASAPAEPAKRSRASEVESFLSAARWNAGAAGVSQPQRTGAFSWVDAAPQKETNDGTHTRLLLLGGLGLIVLAAIGTGWYLNNNFSRSAPVGLTAATPHQSVIIAPKTRPQPVQPQPSLTPSATPAASSAKPAPAATASIVTPQATVTAPRGHATAVQKRLVPSAIPIRTASTPVQTKPLTPLQRLAGLAGAGDPKAQEVLGLQYLDGDGVAVNEAEGAKWLERAAARGEAVAAYRLGTLYERGHGVAADQAKATEWYAVAAKAGNRKAMHNLAVAYAQGTGVQKDLAFAAKWFLRAANLGLPDSQFNLAVLYERGMGVPQSLTEAYKWYAIAAAQGDTGSKTRLDALASQLGDKDKTAAEKAAAAFQPAPLDRAANAPPIAASLVGG